MFDYIKIQNFRRFSQYEVNGLKRVNLLVGRNNCGKTTILEAAGFLGSMGDLAYLSKLARIRRELVYTVENQMLVSYPDVRHLFHGHSLAPGIDFRLESRGIELVTRVPLRGEIPPEDFSFSSPAMNQLYLRVTCATPVGGPDQLTKLGEDGALEEWGSNRHPRSKSGHYDDESEIRYLTTFPCTDEELSQMWDKVLLNSRESEIVDAMQALDPRFTGIHFLSGPLPNQRSRPVVGLEGFEKRVPLGSQGEGLRRLLTIVVAMLNAENGMLLIDEIDTGLHYSILDEMWKLVVQAAIQSDVQVLATTHSLDCIRGLAQLCQSHPELADHVALHKIEPELGEAVTLLADQIVVADEQDIEVR
jgi:hypothetical protein